MKQRLSSFLIPHPLTYGTKNSTSVFGVWRICSGGGFLLS
jgi:hypothetical protein